MGSYFSRIITGHEPDSLPDVIEEQSHIADTRPARSQTLSGDNNNTDYPPIDYSQRIEEARSRFQSFDEQIQEIRNRRNYDFVNHYNGYNGRTSYSTGSSSASLGPNARACHGTIRIGSAPQSIAVGYDASVNHSNSIAIGRNAIATGTQSIAIGRNIAVPPIQSIAIGRNSLYLDNTIIDGPVNVYRNNNENQSVSPWLQSSYGPDLTRRPIEFGEIGEEIRDNQIRREINPEDEITDNEELCCRICMENKIKTVLLPCGHACMCLGCSSTLKNNKANFKCPICNKRVESVQTMFI